MTERVYDYQLKKKLKTFAKMASSPFPFSPTVNHHTPHLAPPSNYNCSATSTISSITFCLSYSSKIILNRSFPSKRNFWLGRCRASTSPSEPPPDKEPPPASDATAFTCAVVCRPYARRI
ncbi:hypothetical protein ACS0TY_021188 [Phlomoides rotata]